MSSQPKRGEGPFIIENSDGCSALSIPYRYITKKISGGAKKLPFLHFCVQHDERYWSGGSNAQRKYADYDLYKGVRSCSGKRHIGWILFYNILALIMLFIVRIFGSAYLPTPFRWNRGEPYVGSYKYTYFDRETQNQTVMTNEDADKVMAMYQSSNSVVQSIVDFVRIQNEESGNDMATNELKKIINEQQNKDEQRQLA